MIDRIWKLIAWKIIPPDLLKERPELASGSRIVLISIICLLLKQIQILKYRHPHIKLSQKEFRQLNLLTRFVPDFEKYLFVVKPRSLLERARRQKFTIWNFINWFKAQFSRKQKKKPGPQGIPEAVIMLIIDMHNRNGWGASKIHNELLLPGFDVSQRSVSNYLNKHFPATKDPVALDNQSWRTATVNLARSVFWSLDFFVDLSATGRPIYNLVVLNENTSQIVTTASTYKPNPEFIKGVFREIFMLQDDDSEIAAPDFLISDNDANFNRRFSVFMAAYGVKHIRTPTHSPWCNGKCERLMRTIREEAFNKLFIVNARHAGKVLKDYASYYNNWRTHSACGGNSPIPRRIVSRPDTSANIKAIPTFYNLVYHYQWESENIEEADVA